MVRTVASHLQCWVFDSHLGKCACEFVCLCMLQWIGALLRVYPASFFLAPGIGSTNNNVQKKWYKRWGSVWESSLREILWSLGHPSLYKHKKKRIMLNTNPTNKDRRLVVYPMTQLYYTICNYPLLGLSLWTLHDFYMCAFPKHNIFIIA